jgi:dihydropteroate synthase
MLNLEFPVVMGILNVTPDSFYDGGHFNHLDKAIERVGVMMEEGATIIDIGGMSSRPGAQIINSEEEADRVIPVIKEVRRVFPDVVISIDTVYGNTAQKALDAGASIINDISGGSIDKEIWEVANKNQVPYILMHMRGTPSTMQMNTTYDDVSLEILKYLRDKVYELRKLGLRDIIVDPGFGFGKSIEQNYELLVNLASFKILDCPILVGLSRKGMIHKVLGITPKEALNGTTATHMVALQHGAQILRVHDVKQATECIKIYLKLVNKN